MKPPAELPPYTVERFSGEVRYVLPRRELGRARHVGWVLVGGGLLATGFMCLWMGMPFTWGIGLLLDDQWFGLLLIGFGLLGLGGLLPALGALGLGVATVSGRSQCTVAVRNGKLYSNENLVFFTWRRKRRVDRIERLSITGALSRDKSEQGQHLPAWGLDEIGYAIAAEGHGLKPFPVAPGYARDILLPLANDLASRIEAEAVLAGFDYSATRLYDGKPQVPRGIEVVDESGDVEGDTPPPIKPVDTDLTIDRDARGLTITVPPAGARKGSKGLFSFSLLWNGFMVLFTVLVVSGMLFGDPANADGNHMGPTGWLGFGGFLALFWLVGLWMLVAAINAGKRRAVLNASADMLQITRESLFGTKSYTFRRNQIDRICAGPSGTEVNDVPVYELQVHSLSGKKLGLLSQRTNEELRWITAELNLALGFSGSAGGKHPGPAAVRNERTGRPVAPAGSRISADHTAERVAIYVPPLGLGPYVVLIVIGLAFSVIGIVATVGVVWSELDDGFQGTDLLTLGFITVWTTLFTGAGLATLCTACILPWRRFHIEVGPEGLDVTRRGLFGSRSFHWNAAEIAEIAVVENSAQAGNRWYQQLCITPHPGHGKPFKMMNGYLLSELAYVKALIDDAHKSVRDSSA